MKNNETIGYMQLLRTNAKYRNLWFGNVISSLGDWFSYVAVLGLVWEVTGSGTSLALTMISRSIPFVIAGMVAGVVLDRKDRRKILIVCDIVRAILAFGYLFVQSVDMIWLVFFLGGFMQVFTAFFSPGVNALLPKLVSNEELGTANALRQSTGGATMVLGSAIGGAIIAFMGRDMAFVLNGISFMLSAYFIWRIRTQAVMDTQTKISFWNDFTTGIHYVWQNRLILAIVVRRIGERLGAGFNLLISVFAVKVWSAGEPGIGFLYSIIGVGLIIGGMVAKRASSRDTEILKSVVGFGNLGEGIFWLLFVLAPNIYVGGILLALMVGSDIVASVTDTTIMQRTVPDHLLGRTFSMRETLLTLSWSIALAVTGVVMNYYTPQQTGYGISAIMLFTAAVWFVAKWAGVLQDRNFIPTEEKKTITNAGKGL